MQTPTKFSTESAKIFWLCFALLFLAVVLFCGKTVPYSNELVYLLRLEPNFLQNDWTFSRPAHEHWLFNFLFTLPSYVFSLETVGWLGRIAVWSLCLWALLKIGRHWKIPLWAIGVSIFLWLAFGQSIVGEEWIFGGFEAKTVAYVCLLFALDFFAKQKFNRSAILLGLSFSFHPAVGFWAIAAVVLILLFEKKLTGEFFKFAAIVAVFSLPGLAATFAEQIGAGSVSSVDDWRFIVNVRAPGNLDFLQFSKSGIFLIYAMLIFNFFALEKESGFALRFLLKLQLLLGAFFLFGVFLRWFEFYSLLRLMPMRLFPIFTPLFFIFTTFYIVPKLPSRNHKIIVLLFFAAAIALTNPIGRGFSQICETAQTWRMTERDDLQKTFRWIAENAPQNAVVISPPMRRDVWYYSRRAAIVSYYYPTYDRLSEWRSRLADLTGNLQISKGEAASEEIEAAFNLLSQSEIEQLKNKYAATHLVSRAVYSYPVTYETKTYKVYQLP